MPKYKEWLAEEGLLRVSAWARDGLSDEQIADKMGIALSTFYDWRKKFSEFSEALKKSKDIADIHVENALYKRALGYAVEEVRIKEEYGEVSERVTTIKHVPPDVGAIALWLKNRRPDKWRDKPVPDSADAEQGVAEKLTEVFGNAQ